MRKIDEDNNDNNETLSDVEFNNDIELQNQAHNNKYTHFQSQDLSVY